MRNAFIAGAGLVLIVVAGCGRGTVTDPATSTKHGAGATKPAPRRHVFVLSIDGLMPETYTNPDKHGLRVPTLRMMRAHGAHSPGVLSAFPSVTYPSHTSMVTGTQPAVHGITTNRQFDPLLKNKDGWRWYAEQIKVPTLWQVSRKAGKRTALINWPVTVGADVDANVPEYWRAGTEDDQRLARALSTPKLLDAVAQRFPGFWKRFTPPDVVDEAAFDIALHLLATQPPELMLLHAWMVDEWQHRKGPWSAEAKRAIETADAQIARFIAALKAAKLWDKSVLVVVSDHGFLGVQHTLRPGVMLVEMGLMELDEDKKPKAWKASVLPNGGQAYFYVKDDADQTTKRALETRLRAMVKPGGGVRRVYTSTEIRARGGDPTAFLAIDAEAGWEIGRGYTGKLTEKSKGMGNHGFDPERPELRASLLIYGPSIAPARLDNARLIDIGPTVAQLLGLELAQAQGKNLLR